MKAIVIHGTCRGTIRFAMMVKRYLGKSIRFPILGLAMLTAFALRLVPGNAAHGIFYRNGFHLLRKHYYVPIPEEDPGDAFWEKRSGLVGLEMNDTYAIDLLDSVFPLYLDEFRSSFAIHKSPAAPAQFCLINGSFMAIDAHVYYIFIRHFKPKQILEIGAGNSTLLAAAACRQNRKEKNGEEPRLTAIEPFPSALLSEGFPGLSQLIKQNVEDVNLEWFSSLQSGDILFIDSTHVLRSGGDVQLEYCEILPRLAPGVLVHIHDISLPNPYPRVYFENQLYWNEQYLLQAFLCFNSRFEVIWPGNYMMSKYPENLCKAFPEYQEMRRVYPSSEPSSFWMRVKS